MDDNGLNVFINGDESSKSEVVYNNVIKNMKLTKDEQVQYLKAKVSFLELEAKNRIITTILILVSIIGIGFGLLLMIMDINWLGALIICSTFIGVFTRFYFMYKATIKMNRTAEFDKIEHLRQILDMRLK